jgi:hypothetical protein
MNAKNDNARDAAVARIARELLRIETLEVRNRDRLDFHDLGVGSIRDALRAAHEAGRASRDAK